MAMSLEIIEESELAKSSITNSDFNDDYKKSLLKLVNITTLTTNGISPEEKIQKMTEAIHLLAMTLIHFITQIDDRVLKSINLANLRQCSNCKAMAYVNKKEEEEYRQRIIDDYNILRGLLKVDGLNLVDTDTPNEEKLSVKYIFDSLVEIFKKPMPYVVLALLAVSPYGVQIILMLINTFVK